MDNDTNTKSSIKTGFTFHPPSIREVRRRNWEQARSLMEAQNWRNTPAGRRPKKILERILNTMERPISVLVKRGLFAGGVRNALTTDLNLIELEFKNLPYVFDGYRILHITDLHLDFLEDVKESVVSAVEKIDTDLLVFTGDYRTSYKHTSHRVIPGVRKIFEVCSPRDGALATLGNHDDLHMARLLEEVGIEPLINETAVLQRDEFQIMFTGVDDPHRFFTPRAREVLSEPMLNFGVALVHSAEMAQIAAKAGYSLYLCGHTHGGQICFPNGRPLFSGHDCSRALSLGLWREDKMVGYTSSGAGVSGFPMRYFSHGEVTLFTLKKVGGA